MKKLLVALFIVALFATQALAIDIEWETKTGHRTSGVYGWHYSYDIGYFNDTIVVEVKVKLTGDDPGIYKDIWQEGIHQIWSTDRFDVPIEFNVTWVEEDPDYTVTVSNEPGGANMLLWRTGMSGGLDKGMAAHEYGHMIGLYDENAIGAVDPETGLINTGGLMQNISMPTLNYYYDDFIEWYDSKKVPDVLPQPYSFTWTPYVYRPNVYRPNVYRQMQFNNYRPRF